MNSETRKQNDSIFNKQFWKTTAIVIIITVVMAGLLFHSTKLYVLKQAENKIQDLLLAHNGIHQYVQCVMLPAFYQYKQEGKIQEDFYAPELLSSSFIVRNQHNFYNKERVSAGLPELYYKLAAENPRNPVNKADKREEKLIKMFNEQKEIKKHSEVIQMDNKRYLYVAVPFLENQENCIKCHGNRENAPEQLREIYKGQGGFNEKTGDIRAIISIRAPLDREYFNTYIIFSALLAGLIGIIFLFLFNIRLKKLVHTRTIILEQEVVERKQTATTLRESERQYRLLADNVFDVIWTMDMAQRFTYVSPSVQKLFGYTPEEAMQIPLENTLTPESYEKSVSVMMEKLAGKGNHAGSPDGYRILELEHIQKDGSTIWAEVTTSFIRDKGGSPSGIIGITRDITERKQADEALQESESKYRSMMEAMNEPVYICSPDYRVEYVNPAMIRRIGRDATGEPCFKAIHDLDEKCPWCVHDKIQQDESCEMEIVSPKDNRSYHVFCSPIVHGDGFISGMTIYRDTTDIKKIEAQLQQAQKMESVGRLAGGVAHDYNNALSVIIGFTEMAIEDVDPAGPLRDNLNEVLGAARRAEAITRQLLAFARKQIIAPTVLDLNENVEGTLNMLRRLIGEDIDLTWSPGTGLWPVNMDPSQIDQILANLCVNARDAIDGVGKMTIETENISFNEGYCVDHPGFVPGEFVLLAVSDNGCGMDKEILDNIFEPFFTTKAVDKGTGLGMAMVYGIAKQNNGFINVYSEPDKGTTIRIYLPRHEGKVVGTQDKSQAQIPKGRGETILVVEDDLSILKLAEKILNGIGYTVLSANTTENAIDLAKAHADEIHLLITDVIMPEMNGRELAQQLQTLYPDLRRIFMSGYTANVIAHHGVLDEGVHFIQKPFSRRDLARIVRKALVSEY